MATVLNYLHLLATGVLIGKVVLLSFVVAPILARTLEREPFGQVARQLFPTYYALGMGAAGLGLVSLFGIVMIRGLSASLLLTWSIWIVVLVAESYCRTPLTSQSNAMRDRLKEQEARGGADPTLQGSWNRLHQRSIYLNSLVLVAGLCLLGLAGHR
jgi:hypothetical protein